MQTITNGVLTYQRSWSCLRFLIENFSSLNLKILCGSSSWSLLSSWLWDISKIIARPKVRKEGMLLLWYFMMPSRICEYYLIVLRWWLNTIRWCCNISFRTVFIIGNIYLCAFYFYFSYFYWGRCKVPF